MIPGVTDVATEVSVDVTGSDVKGALVISVERISARKTPTFRSQTDVMADILLALDRGDIAFLTLLDLSAAFDTVDHATLLNVKAYRNFILS